MAFRFAKGASLLFSALNFLDLGPIEAIIV